MKFRLRKGKGSVSGFTDAEGVTHVPGDIVDLPMRYKGEKWLEVVGGKVAVPMVPVEAKVEVPVENVELVPLVENPKAKQKVKPSQKR